MIDSEDNLPPLDEEEVMSMAERLENIPLDEAEWVVRLFMECRRARESEAKYLADSTLDAPPSESENLAQLVLDTAQWLRTLWEVGYLGASHLPAAPRSEFPRIEIEDIHKSALFARIRQGKPPLPFPPPTRNGVPWHEVVESLDTFLVEVSILHDEDNRPLRAVIEGCRLWHILDAEGSCYTVQHQLQGPIYSLELLADREAGHAHLQRRPPEVTCQIVQQFRAGYRSFLLQWPLPDGKIRPISLKAVSADRAEAEAFYWLAQNHPEQYGRIRFELIEQ